jgi:hypothetical protein
MTGEPPDRLSELAITDGDLRTDARKLLTGMQALRGEALADRALDQDRSTEYARLAYRLAGLLTSYARPELERKIITAATRLDEEPLLVQYDPLQDGHWREHQPAFLATLDGILRDLAGTAAPVHRHHVLQAIKCIGMADPATPAEERAAIHGTIQPYQAGIPATEAILAPLTARLSAPCTVGTDGLDAAVDCAPSDLPAALDAIAGLGYADAYAVLPLQEISRLGIPGAVPLENIPVERTPARGERIAGALIRYTLPAAYLLLGSLSGKLQQYLEDRLGREAYDARTASNISKLTVLAGSIGTAATLAATTGKLWYAFLALPGLIETGWRHLASDATPHKPEYTYKGPAGTAAGALLCRPFEQAIERSHQRLLERRCRDQSRVRFRIPLDPWRQAGQYQTIIE